MKAVGLPVLLLLALLASPCGASTPDAALRQGVEVLAALVSDGHAQLDDARIDAVPSGPAGPVAVFFSLQGPAKGNGSWQFLAFFERNEAIGPDIRPSSGYRLVAFRRVGSRGTRLFDPRTASFRAGTVTVSGAAYGPGDAMCCPSVAVHSAFRVDDGVVVEQRAGG